MPQFPIFKGWTTILWLFCLCSFLWYRLSLADSNALSTAELRPNWISLRISAISMACTCPCGGVHVPCQIARALKVHYSAPCQWLWSLFLKNTCKEALSGDIEVGLEMSFCTSRDRDFLSPSLYQAEWLHWASFLHFWRPFAGAKGFSQSEGLLYRERLEANNSVLRSLLWGTSRERSLQRELF